MVVATPCPLILAAPVAFVAGISRAAHRGIIIKGGGALEALARTRTLLLDKTGTLTTGVPAVTRIATFIGIEGIEPADLLGLAASLDQVSPHVLAASIVAEAQRRELPLRFPLDANEIPGTGIEGLVDGRRVALGKCDWIAAGRPLPPEAVALRQQIADAGLSNVFVGVDGAMAGVIVLEDRSFRKPSTWR
ncbi:MAG TPA: HAD family hydrolase [Thermoanaerobaculia bacterium]|jgi:cation transport ATPase|nr:HAD family hydrolase [Thermoanaerobaculia bacterium]